MIKNVTVTVKTLVLWFKAYLTIGDKHQLSLLSSVLYVNLFNPGDSGIGHDNLKLNLGITIEGIDIERHLAHTTYSYLVK